MQDLSTTEEEMLLSFEAFMLGGSVSIGDGDSSQINASNSGNKKKKGRRGRNQEHSCSSLTPTSKTKEESVRRQNIVSILKIEKQSWNHFRTFCKIVQNHWIHLDDQVVNVISSIENIQSRLPTEMKLISKLMSSKRDTASTHRSRESAGFLNLEDIQLALSHDLLQQEKMVAALRKLVSDLSESLQMIGRQLNDALHHHHEASRFLFSFNDLLKTFNQEEMYPSVMGSMRLIDDMNDIFLMLSRESYRKQCLSIILLDRINDSALDKSNKHLSPKAVSSSMWSRRSQRSCMDITRFEKILEMSRSDFN